MPSPLFRLLLLVNLTARPFARLYERRHRIGLAEWRVLHAVAETPGIAAAEVCDVLGLDKMAVSRAVRGLEARGRIARTADPADHRRASLAPTEAGRVLHAMIQATGQAREEALMSALEPAERAAFDAILDKLVARARAMPDP